MSKSTNSTRELLVIEHKTHLSFILIYFRPQPYQYLFTLLKYKKNHLLIMSS
ncbi:hypothetical protein FHW89_005714 [Mucilaginibacter sp. SG564]|nr:hypothetical protein [Mucilaginibacter sp. SG564]